MSTSQGYVALDWVRGEIEQTLTLARNALELYVGHREDSTQAGFCLNYLHQVQGSLRMVELHGAALFTKEMENLCIGLRDGAAANFDESVESLMTAILRLQNYLESVSEPVDDIPNELMSVFNDLRAAQGASFETEESSSNELDLTPARPSPRPELNARMSKPGVNENLRKLRQMLQGALAGIIRNQDTDDRLEYFIKVITKLEKFCKGSPLGAMWWIALGFVETQKGQQETLGSAVKQLLRELDSELKGMIEAPEDALTRPVSDELLRNMLFYIGKSDSQEPHVIDIKGLFDLQDVAASEDPSSSDSKALGPDKDTMASVSAVIIDELAALKDRLDLIERNSDATSQELKELIPSFKQLEGTLAVIGVQSARNAVLEQISELEAISTDEVSDDLMMSLADAVLTVEAQVSHLKNDPDAIHQSESFSVPSEQFESAHGAVIVASKAALEKAKNAIVSFITSQWDHKHIEEVPDVLDEVRGGLQIIPLEEASRLVASCGDFIRDKLLGEKAVPDWSQLDRLADAISSIEYYIERVAEGANPENDRFLNVARESLQKLGQFDEVEIDDEQHLTPHHESVEAAESPDAQAKQSDVELIDQDILEIFAEEVGEVGEEIDAALTVLRSDEENTPALAELRRAFHTLKGSGRLVGAAVMGELAWVVESRLNALIDAPEFPNLTELAAIQKVRDGLDALLGEFSRNEDSGLAENLESQLSAAFGIKDDAELVDEDDASEKSPALGIEKDEISASTKNVLSEMPSSDEVTVDTGAADQEQEENLIDEEILEIFIEEAEEVCETIQEYLPRFINDYDDNEALVELRRAYHTLKGSGRMVEAFTIGDIAWAVENLLNRIIDKAVEMRPAVGVFVNHVSGAVPALVENFKSGAALPFSKEECEEVSQELIGGRDAELGATEPSEGAEENIVAAAAEDDRTEDIGATSDTPAELALDEAETEVSVDRDEKRALDPLMEIFEAEALQHIAAVESFASAVKESGEHLVDDALSRALHTLKGSANTADIKPIADIAIPLESVVKEVRAHQLMVDNKLADLLGMAMDYVRQAVQQLAIEPQHSIEGSAAFLSALAAYKEKRLVDTPEGEELSIDGAQDPHLVSIFLTEGLDILLDAERVIDEWQEGAISDEDFGKLYSEVTTLKRGAKVASLPAIVDICGALEECYSQIHSHDHEPEKAMIASIKEGHDALIDLMDQTAAGLTAELDQDLIVRLEKIAQAHAEVQDASLGLPSEEEAFELSDELEEIEATEALPIDDAEAVLPEGNSDDGLLEESLVELEASIEDAIPELKKALPEEPILELEEPVLEEISEPEEDLSEPTGGGLAELDPELAEIFLEEAQDLIEHSSELLHQWEQASDDFTIVGELQRDLHTLKGGARMAEVPAIGDLAHELETLFEKTVESQTVATPEVIQLCLKCHDALAGMVDAVGRNANPAPATALLDEVRSIVSGKPAEPALSNEIQPSEMGVEELQPAPTSIVEEAGAESEPDDHANETESAAEAHAQEKQTSEESAQSLGGLVELDPELAEIFLEEAQDLIEHSSELLHQWEQASDDFALVGELQRDLHTLKGGARMAEVAAIGDLSHELETLFEKTVESQSVATPEVIQLCLKCHDALAGMVDAVGQNSNPAPATALLNDVRNVVAGRPLATGSEECVEEPVIEPTPEASSETEDLVEEPKQEIAEQPEEQEEATATSEPESITESGTATEPEEIAAAEAELESAVPAPSRASTFNQDDFDLEVLEMFGEEAQELVEALEVNLADWTEAPQDQHFNQELQRVLHTLKGGARLASLDDLAEESHKLESRLIKAFESGEEFAGDLKTEVLQAQDILISLVKGFLAPETQEASENTEDKSDKAEATIATPATAKVTQLGGSKPEDKAVAKPDKKVAAQETVRIGASLIEHMVNLAGETSISRGRIEQQISDFSFTLEEMTATIERLREQLRRMDIETEAQVLYRAEQEGFTAAEYEEFDPLEMDQYSTIQTLSRALSESATDLSELRESLADRARDAETVLLQQSRINSELQESLMKTRMIPFSSMVPRLRRIVRQISGELDKAVEFNVANAEGEMDRSVLDRMIAPLEHMLRNALDHGIENKEQRVSAGKPEVGQINLSMSREGGDIVIRMKDDGGGIDGQRVLEKAISQGLVKEGVRVPHQEILQFIMTPGFSTAAQVTQISGRGVGMDVVASEIKQLGGTISIESQLGQGTEFTVRLPFTVSVNRALMVATGEDFYAIPLNTIEGIVRVSPYELEEYYQPDAPPYRYAGRDYNLKYLGTLLHSSHHPKLTGQAMPLPVILVRGSDSPMALQVDQLMGSREIVVKSLGPQFGNVHGVSGATILGDGSVVVILDLPAMIRDETAGVLDVLDKDKSDTDIGNRTPVVMVVDDSVTVRKVTSRFLERNGLDVITAKDGVDAIAQLQDVKPDVMLLDIEMPRMDGFEVATLVRHDDRLKDVPIIMITSRTGQKHRDRAMAIGVNEYLGKPFQEQHLLERIEAILAEHNVEEI